MFRFNKPVAALPLITLLGRFASESTTVALWARLSWLPGGLFSCASGRECRCCGNAGVARRGDGVSFDLELPTEVGGDDGTGGSWIRRAEYVVGMRTGAGNNFGTVGLFGTCAL